MGSLEYLKNRLASLGADYKRALDEGRLIDAGIFEARIDELEMMLLEMEDPE